MLYRRAERYILWLIQILSLVIILWCSWLLLNREGFALVAASISLVISLYVEHIREGLNGGTTEPAP